MDEKYNDDILEVAADNLMEFSRQLSNMVSHESCYEINEFTTALRKDICETYELTHHKKIALCDVAYIEDGLYVFSSALVCKFLADKLKSFMTESQE